MAIYQEQDPGTPGRSSQAAIEDPAARRGLRKRWLLAAAVLAVGLLLIASNPLLRGLARSRERAFEAGAELVTAEVVRTHEGMVTVRWYDLDFEYEGDVWVVSSGAYEPGEKVEVLVDEESETVHMPGSAIDFLEFPLDDVHTFGWMAGLLACAISAHLLRQAARVRSLLAGYPWRTLSLRWDPRADCLVGVDGGTLVSFDGDEPEGVTVEVAGPEASRAANARSVMRAPLAARLRLADGPRIAVPPPPPRSAGSTWSFPRGRFVAQGTQRRRELRTDEGVTFARVERDIERITVWDSAGEVQLRVRGRRKVTVFDARGEFLGKIHFRALPGAADVSTSDGATLAKIRPRRTNRTIATSPGGAALGTTVYKRSVVPYRGTVTLTVEGDLGDPQRSLVTLAMLTSRWRPLEQGGGGG